MNKTETTVSLAIVSMALLATITMISPNQALALGQWNTNEVFTPNGDVAEDGMDSSDSSDEEEGDSITAAGTDEDKEQEEGSEDSSDTSDGKEHSSSSGYQAFQDCLAEIKESPTEEQVQDCIDSSYGPEDENEDASSESTDEGDEGDTDVPRV
jgi:hypothetical protein